MVTFREVQSDLKEIRYYYAKKDMFESASRCIVGSGIAEKVRRYNLAMANAPPALRNLLPPVCDMSHAGKAREEVTMQSVTHKAVQEQTLRLSGAKTQRKTIRRQKVKFPAFAKDAVNVYRTKQYIVKQNISLDYNERDGRTVISHDTFYKRTPERDKQYDMLFSELRNRNGKRIPSTAYTRRYID